MHVRIINPYLLHTLLYFISTLFGRKGQLIQHLFQKSSLANIVGWGLQYDMNLVKFISSIQAESYASLQTWVQPSWSSITLDTSWDSDSSRLASRSIDW